MASKTKVPRYDLDIYQGEDATILAFRWLQPDKQPVDLTGCSVRMQIRTLTGDLLIDRDMDHGIEIADGVITIKVSATELHDITAKQAFYDVFVTDSMGQIHKVLFGEARIISAITR